MPIIQFNKDRIEQDINTLAKSERITKAKLSVLSRTVLAYVYETNDVAMVTRLLNVLTPVNKRVAAMYFPHFLGWSYNEENFTFGKKAKEKMHSKKFDLTVEWLEDEANDIWVWADNNVQMQVKPKDYAKKLTQLVTKALKDEDEGIDAKDVLYAILASDELSLQDLMQPLNDIKEAPLKEDAA